MVATLHASDALRVTRRSVAGVASAAACAAAAPGPALAVVTKEQRDSIFFLYGEKVPADMTSKEFNARYAAGTSFSQERQDAASSLESKMGISSSQSSERASKLSSSEQRDLERKRELSQLKAPKPKPVPRSRRAE